MGPEAKFYREIKKNIPNISWIRLENLSLSGTPDLLGYNNSGHFFTVELKVTKGNKLRFSPHQIAFHKRHPKNTFIMVKALGPLPLKTFSWSMYKGTRISELAACGLTLDADYSGLDACRLALEAV
jgi:Holliday junction resolvase